MSTPKNAETESETKPSFEALTAELDEVLELLERGDLSLDDALATYERGVDLVRRSNEVLDQAELRISELSVSLDDQPPSRGGSVQRLFPFGYDDEDEDEE